ncbi:hypothetical protein [Curtobacterium sp. B8]|uniref:hypothetical protein n=1 Tax=Curtobacterium sp. B8 TaxID=95611 RepID=UPI0011D1B984|nr:hypothetical protein [Curtobacterium sp. B8]
MAHKMQFGFQLHQLTLFYGNARTEKDFRTDTLQPKGNNVLASLRELSPSIYDVTRIDDFAYRTRERQADVALAPALRIEHIDATSQDRIDIEFRYGRVGSHDLAIAKDRSEDAALDSKASTNPYRASIYLPKSGNRAVLMCEARGASCPSTYLLKALCLHMRDTDAERPEADRQGWWRLKPHQVSDTGRLEEVLRQGNGAGLQLEKRILKPGQTRGGEVITLRRNGLPVGKLSAVKSMVLGWVGMTPEKGADAAPSGKPTEQVSSLIGVQVSADDFDDGAVTYDQGDGKTQTIRPDSVRDIFTYPVKVGLPPTPSEIRNAAEERLQRLQPTLGIQLSI